MWVHPLSSVDVQRRGAERAAMLQDENDDDEDVFGMVKRKERTDQRERGRRARAMGNGHGRRIDRQNERENGETNGTEKGNCS